MRCSLFAIAALCASFLCNLPAPARAAEPEVPLAKRIEEYGKLQQELIAAFGAKDYDKVAEICRKQMKLVPQSPEPHYNLACALAQTGHQDDA